MKALIKKVKEFFSVPSHKPSKLEELYLAQAMSLEEVERRQQQIMRGEAPWQR